MLYELHCEKCKEEIVWTPQTTLAGGVNTYLCIRCSTEWDRCCRVHPAFQRLRELNSVRASITYARELSVDSSDPELKRVLDECFKRELELHQVSLEWLGREV